MSTYQYPSPIAQAALDTSTHSEESTFSKAGALKCASHVPSPGFITAQPQRQSCPALHVSSQERKQQKKVRFHNKVLVRPSKRENFRDDDLWYSEAELKARKSSCRRTARAVRSSTDPVSDWFCFRDMSLRLYEACLAVARQEEELTQDVYYRDFVPDNWHLSNIVRSQSFCFENEGFIMCFGLESRAIKKIRADKEELRMKLQKDILRIQEDASLCRWEKMARIQSVSEKASLSSRLMAYHWAKVHASQD